MKENSNDEQSQKAMLEDEEQYNQEHLKQEEQQQIAKDEDLEYDL